MPMNRRDFLKTFALMVSTTLVARLPFSQAQSANKSVLIIGAGMAGLRAGYLLNQEGYQVTTLEARDRIGGRIWTSKDWENAPLDLGASWIHGVNNNPLTALSDELGIERIVSDYENTDAFDVDGTRLTISQLLEMAIYQEAIIEAVYEEAEELDFDAPLADVINDYVELESLSTEELRFLNFMLVSNLENDLAATVEELSAWYFYESSDLIGTP